MKMYTEICLIPAEVLNQEEGFHSPVYAYSVAVLLLF